MATVFPNDVVSDAGKRLVVDSVNDDVNRGWNKLDWLAMETFCFTAID